MEKFVAIDFSKAYLLSRLSYESRLILNDTWLSDDKRYKTVALHHEIGTDFNRFFEKLHNVKCPNKLYVLAVKALEIFRDNLDSTWHFAYSKVDQPKNIVWLNK